MKQILIIILVIILAGCSTQKHKKYRIPKKPKFEIIRILTVEEIDSLYANELRFNYVISSMNTMQVMYDKFGMWNQEIRLQNKIHPILVWKNVKLSKSINESFTIAASGVEYWNGMYASIKAFDSKNDDCLNPASEYKNLVIDYFAYNIKHLNNKNDFFKVYWKMINDYKTKHLEKN